MIDVRQPDPHHLAISCPSDLVHMDALVEHTDAFLAGQALDDELAYKVVLLMTEAATNAIEHGNAHDPEKNVAIDIRLMAESIEVTVEDEGAGFDPSTVLNPVAAENLLLDGGRGLFFIREMADEVHLENEGRRIRIVFVRPPTTAASR